MAVRCSVLEIRLGGMQGSSDKSSDCSVSNSNNKEKKKKKTRRWLSRAATACVLDKIAIT